MWVGKISSRHAMVQPDLCIKVFENYFAFLNDEEALIASFTLFDDSWVWRRRYTLRCFKKNWCGRSFYGIASWSICINSTLWGHDESGWIAPMQTGSLRYWRPYLSNWNLLILGTSFRDQKLKQLEQTSYHQHSRENAFWTELFGRWRLDGVFEGINNLKKLSTLKLMGLLWHGVPCNCCYFILWKQALLAYKETSGLLRVSICSSALHKSVYV